MVMVEIVRGDIAEQRVDAIVSPTHAGLHADCGASGAIQRAAGPELLRACLERFPQGLATGAVGWTPAFQLPARWVLHTVGPDFRAGERDRSKLIACYADSLAVAESLGAHGVAFPVISAGAFGWPVGEAAETAIDTLVRSRAAVGPVRIVTPDASMVMRLQAQLWLPGRQPPRVLPSSVGSLFEARTPRNTQLPSGAGMLRGDVYLEAILRGRTARLPIPDEPGALRHLLSAEVARVTGTVPVRGHGTQPTLAHVPELNPGHGMSAGMVNLRWWAEARIPSLLTAAGKS